MVPRKNSLDRGRGFSLLAIVIILGFLSCRAGAGNSTTKEKQQGTLRIEGQDVRSLALHGGRRVFLENPGSTVQAPVGKYDMIQVTVGKTNSAIRFVSHLFQSMEITTNQTASLQAGGPLTNLLSATLQGRTLHLDYRLLGAQGHSYSAEDRRIPPRLSVRRNGQTVHTGTFEYG